jgi:SAM-dependent methyltransferase
LPTSTYVIQDQEQMARAKNYFAWLSRLVLPELGQRVIEVGCGIGNFTGALLDREIVIATDAEPECIERLRRRYPHETNLRTLPYGVASSQFSTLASFRADSCVCMNVLEHIEDDAGALRSMAAVLSPPARIALFVPAFPSLYGPADGNMGHYRRYTRKSLHAVAEAAGLRVLNARYVNLAGFFGWWTNAHVFRRADLPATQIELFDWLIVPVLSRAEAVFHPPFGQSLFAVLTCAP